MNGAEMDTKLLLPPNSVYEARFCVWSDLSFVESEKLLAKGMTSEQIKNTLKKMLEADVAMVTVGQAEIALDLYTHGVIFARKSHFSPLQLSTLIAVLKRVHEACISTPFENEELTMRLFKELMVKHSVDRPPYSSNVFSLAQVKDITDYVLTTYFKHFKLYKFAFTKRVRLDLHFGDFPVSSDEEVQISDDLTNKVEASEGGGDCDGESPSEQEQEQVREDSPDKEIEATEKPPEDESRQKLKNLIGASIDEKLQLLQATLETQMEEQEKELLSRISNLEQCEGKPGSKTKRSK